LFFSICIQAEGGPMSPTWNLPFCRIRNQVVNEVLLSSLDWI
ncbi:MAG: hypothetical protein ACI9FN_003345, partial [Saprospiraceae bacterium]